MKHTSDDDHRMRPHDINHLVAAKLPEMVGANDRVFVTPPNLVHPRLELDDIIDMRLISNRPVHTTTNATQRICSPGAVAGQLLEHRDHAIWIENAIRKVSFGIAAKLELPGLLRNRCVDTHFGQSLQMILTLLRIQDVNRLVARLESVFYEWKQDPILFFGTVEESADMARLVELGTSKRNGSRYLLHSISQQDIERAPVEYKNAPF